MTTRIHILSALLLLAGCLHASALEIRITGFTEYPLKKANIIFRR